MCQEHRYEVALVDAGMRSPQTVLSRARPARPPAAARGARLHDRRRSAPSIVATLGADPVPIEEAATAVLQVLSQTAEG